MIAEDYYKRKNSLIFIFGCAGSSSLHVGFLVEARWGYSLFTLQGLLIAVASRCRARALGPAGSVILAPGL